MIPWPGAFSWCAGGQHIANLSDLTVHEGGRYCASHLPPEAGEPSEPLPETPEWKMSPRRRKHVAFQKWRYEHGHITGDDKAEPLTDAEIDHLANHVLP